ncbi:serine/threonine protein kinase [Okibacterium sp. HSC-33S16]|uniref:serine/threonine-protein kinase n=1 Tax=Okibacterium sp. HSC-33S16 TaxID=2910965 RepID=UPI0020A21CEC|nr:serine/threonine-protein kinase [Okibacterium sp. HSC-33S16]MCP2031618.1 serine/threonine protein kinase [Okibacterium sp. HSC-33S16]
MARRLPSQPPALPGFSFVRILGSGGFADVFLYEQDSPRRQVAVKVMLSEYVNVEVRRMFQAEADLMAQLSAHPAILTVYQSGVAADGRPFLVMELCSAVIGETYRDVPLSVSEALRVGIKIASAVETAHEAGVLHRDIKPANILMTAYGNPVLSDFGIAGTLGESVLDDTVGMSIPWSAPEVLHSETNGTLASEVFSLGATIYSLLAGRAPFEHPHSDNSSASLISRASRGKPQPIGRADVPERLERVLARSMSRQPAQRQQSAMELIRELQAVEAELGFTQTQPDVAVSAWAQAAVVDSGDKTRVQAIRTVDPGKRRRRTAEDSSSRPGATRAAVKDSGSRDDRSSGARPRIERGRAFVTAIVVCSVLVLLLAATTVFVLVRISGSDGIPAVANVSAELGDSGVVFSWADPGIGATDSYQIRTADGVASVQKSTEFTIDANPGDRVCVTVRVSRDGSLGPASSEKCVDIPAGTG